MGHHCDRGNFEQQENEQLDHVQKHVHEFLGSVRLAELEEDPHNHRFAGVSGEAKGKGKSHVHKLKTRTDFVDHYHEIEVTTGPAIDVGGGKHVHFVESITTEVDGHVHTFAVATLIESPLVEERKCK